MSALRKSWEIFCRHRYLVAIFIFITVVGFLDPNSFYQLHLQRQEIKGLNKEIEAYRAQYENDTKMLKELDANPEAMKKIARERYFMKKPNEDVYVIREE